MSERDDLIARLKKAREDEIQDGISPKAHTPSQGELAEQPSPSVQPNISPQDAAKIRQAFHGSAEPSLQPPPEQPVPSYMNAVYGQQPASEGEVPKKRALPNINADKAAKMRQAFGG